MFNIIKTTTFVVFFIFYVSAFASNRIMSKNDYSIPDFAYPETVAKDTEQLLSQALKGNNYPMILRYAMNLSVARSLKSSDAAIPQNLALFDSLTKTLPAPYSSMAGLLEAEIFRSLYNSNRRNFSSRKLPLEKPWPEDVNEWSGEMIADTVCSLISTGEQFLISGKDETTKAGLLPIDQISVLLDYHLKGNDQKKIDLNFYEFYSLKGGEILRSFVQNSGNETIPFYKKENKEKNMSPYQKAINLSDNLYSALIKTSKKEDRWIIAAIAIKNKTGLFENDERQKSYLEEQLDSLKNT